MRPSDLVGARERLKSYSCSLMARWDSRAVADPRARARSTYKRSNCLQEVCRTLGSLVDSFDPAPDISSRNIYYKDPALFRSQTVVDRYIDIVAYTLGVQRAALNVVSSRNPFSGFRKHPTNWFPSAEDCCCEGPCGW